MLAILMMKLRSLCSTYLTWSTAFQFEQNIFNNNLKLERKVMTNFHYLRPFGGTKRVIFKKANFIRNISQWHWQKSTKKERHRYIRWQKSGWIKAMDDTVDGEIDG